jgi:hypothetical protein
MKRLTQVAMICALFMVGAAGQLNAQDKIREAKKAEQPSFTPAQKHVMNALAAQSPFTYLTDGKGKFKRVSFGYTEVNFAGTCNLHYVEHEFVANQGVGATDDVHRYTPTNVDLADLLAGDPKVVKLSAALPAPPDFRYSADAYVIDFPGRQGKAVHRFAFESEQSARNFIGLVRKAAQSCESTH